MKITLQLTISPEGKHQVYPSLEIAEAFITELLASQTAIDLAQKFQIETPRYERSCSKLHAALGFCRVDDRAHSFSCWEQAEGGKARKVCDFDTLSPAAVFNGDQGRSWKQSGGEWIEENAGIHRLLHNGQLVKTLWIEAEKR